MAGLAVLLTGMAVAVPVISSAREGDPASNRKSGPVASAPTPPPTSPNPETVLPDAKIAPAEGPVPQPSKAATKTASIPERGTGRFKVAAAPAGPVERATTYRVEVEEGLPYTARRIAHAVETILSDNRGWAAKHPLARVDGHADLRIVLATPKTADELCAPLETGGRLSCRNGGNVVLNAWRWQFGADTYANDLAAYRRYVVNHETGHAIGYPHVGCPGVGAPAPVMLQQTKGLDGCTANPWPARVDLAGH